MKPKPPHIKVPKHQTHTFLAEIAGLFVWESVLEDGPTTARGFSICDIEGVRLYSACVYVVDTGPIPVQVFLPSPRFNKIQGSLELPPEIEQFGIDYARRNGWVSSEPTPS